MTEFTEFVAGANDAGRRLDRVVRKFLGEVSLGAIYRAIRTGSVLVNGAKRREDYRVHSGDKLRFAKKLIDESDLQTSDRAGETDPARAEPAVSLTAPIVFENEHILILNKPRGMLVHGHDSLEQEVRAYLTPKLPPSLSFRPGPLHRIDRNTSGLVTFGISIRGAERFTELLSAGQIRKIYLALVDGTLRRAAVWTDPLARDTAHRVTRIDPSGKTAVTRAIPLISAKGRTLAAIEIETGRTHQIRAQAALHGHPLSGDRKYGSIHVHPYLLHAFLLRPSRLDPILGFASLSAPLPPAATKLLRAFFDSQKLARALRQADRMAESDVA